MNVEKNISGLQINIKLSTDNRTTILALSKYKFLKSITPVTKRTKYSLAQFERGVNLELSLDQLMKGNHYPTELLLQPSRLEAFLVGLGLPQNAFDEFEVHHVYQLDRELRKLLYNQRITPFELRMTHKMNRGTQSTGKQSATLVSPKKKAHGSK